MMINDQLLERRREPVPNSVNLELARKLLKKPAYPRTATYDPDWLVSLEMGCPTFWLLERLCEVIHLHPGMRILDLGCGQAGGSIFLAKEFNAQVWAVDLRANPTENYNRICKAGFEKQIFPMKADARDLPFADGFFDAVISINALWFFATDDLYLRHRLTRLVKPGGKFGIVNPGFRNKPKGELPASLPDYLKPYWDACALSAWHSAEWWRRHWLKTGQVGVLLADNFPGNECYQTYLDWERIIGYPEKLAQDDAGRSITFTRLVAAKKQDFHSIQ